MGDSSHRRQLYQLALRSSVRPTHRRVSAVARGRRAGSAGLLDFSRRVNLHDTLVRDRAGRDRLGAGGEASRANRRTPVSALAFLLIVISLLSFVVAQLILKRAMEFSTEHGLRNARFVYLAAIGVGLMTISFFLTLGLLQRFDLSYLYPFQGLTVIFITLLAAVALKENLSARLTLGTLLITAGIVLVSIS